jgi:hypothetical protein
MIECLQLRGLSERTQESYVRAVRQLAERLCLIYEAGVGVKTEVELDAEAPKRVSVNRWFFDIKPS